MKKVFAIIIALIVCLSSLAAFAQTERISPTGLWYAYLADGESTLFLREDGTGSMQIGEISYNIAWQESNGVITMDQGGALVDGVYDESALSLSIGGGNLIYLRQQPTPTPLDSDLTGAWRAPMLGGDSTLTLNADGSAVLQLGPDAIPLAWTHEGAAVTLLQDGLAIDCTYDGVFISILLGEGSISFMQDALPADTAQ